MIEELITENMGFCCLYAFFTKYRQTSQIAFRLGVSDRAIRSYKERFKAGEFECKKCENCLKGKLF
jgi:hypothetical protein